MKEFIKGQRAKLADFTPITTIEVSIQIIFTTPKKFDCSCFGVDNNDQLSDDRYFIVRSKVKTTAFRRSDLSLKPFAVLSCKDGVSIR